MALTITAIPGTDTTVSAFGSNVVSKNHKVKLAVDLGSYLTTGIEMTVAALTAAIYGTATTIRAVSSGISPDGTHMIVWVPSTGKFMSFVNATGAETANAVDLSSVGETVEIEVEFI